MDEASARTNIDGGGAFSIGLGKSTSEVRPVNRVYVDSHGVIELANDARISAISITDGDAKISGTTVGGISVGSSIAEPLRFRAYLAD